VSAEPPAPRVWTAGLLRAAGLLAVAGLALWFALGPSAPQATAALATALEHARRTAELAYGLELVRPARRGPDLEGTLYVRGDEAFALHTRSPMGADLWLGGDRREVWLVPGAASLPVLVAERGSAMLELFDEHGLELPFVDVVTALEACARDFEVELHDGGRLLRGVRRAGAGPGPDTLELQLDGQGRLARLELRRTGLAPALDWCFALERRQETVEPAVLELESHHDPGRRVLRR
jgi:hypothetical protein